jgi:hypothetical protein
MARPWVRLWWIDTIPVIAGREDKLLPGGPMALAYLHRDKDYRIAWDAVVGKWAVYYRANGL